jgi:hypothetical protein
MTGDLSTGWRERMDDACLDRIHHDIVGGGPQIPSGSKCPSQDDETIAT